LLAKHLVLRIGEYAQHLAAQHGFHYISGMTTNATRLDAETLQELVVRGGVKHFQITLEGPQEVHDQIRVRVNGSGTFAAVMAALKVIKASTYQDVRVRLRLHFTPVTLKRIVPFIEELNHTLLDDSRFTLAPHAVQRLGGKEDDNIPAFSSLEEEALAQQLVLGQKPPQAEGSVCYAAEANAFVIRANGLVSKCTVALEHHRNLIGRITSKGELELDPKTTQAWSFGLATGDTRQLACPAHHVLRGDRAA